MQLQFFPSKGRPLFSMLWQPAGGESGKPAVVLCHSFGAEHGVSGRLLSLMVRVAAKHGLPAFLYHSRGHGDSAGDFCDLGFEDLVEDALAAGEYVCRLSGSRRVVWVGLRFGTLTAAAAAQRFPDSAGLALWEPIHQGRDYFVELIRGLLFSATARGLKPPISSSTEMLAKLEREGSADILGSEIHARFYQETRDLNLQSLLQNWSGPTFVAQIQPRVRFAPKTAALVTDLETRGNALRTLVIREEPGWQFPLWRQPWVSNELLDQTGAWLDGLA